MTETQANTYRRIYILKSCFPTNIIIHGAGNPQNAPGDAIQAFQDLIKKS